MYVSHLIL